MKPLESKKAYKFRMACVAAREEYAAKTLDANATSEAAAKAAADGFELVRVRIDRPLDLRQTDAAKRLKTALDAEGLAVEWEPRSVLARESPNGCDCIVYDLIVRW